MDNDNENDHPEKQKECRSRIHQTTLPPPRQPVQQSSSSALPQPIQEEKKQKLTDPQPHFSSRNDQPISRSPNSGPVESPFQAAAAQLQLMKRKERFECKLTLVGGQSIAKKNKRQRGPNREWTPPGPSPLGPGPSPYERVRKVVSVLKKYLRLDSTINSSPPPVTGKPTLEKVILMLDEYMEGIPRSVTEEDMEMLLRCFQRNVDLDDEEICWYGLMKESKEAFWNSLTEHFICDTFFESDLEEEEEDGDDEGESDDDDNDSDEE